MVTDTVSAAKVWIDGKFTHFTKFVHAVIFFKLLFFKKTKENQSAYPQMSLLAQKKKAVNI